MSSTVSLEPQAPQAAPDQPQQPAKEPVRPRRLWLWVVVVAVLTVVAVLIPRRQSQAIPRTSGLAPQPDPFVPATRGSLVRSIRIGGTVGALRFANIAAPALRGQGGAQLTVVRLVEAGSRVQKEDLLTEFDRQSQTNNFQDREADFISLNDQIAKRRSEMDIERERQQSDLQKARADVESARLENRRNEVISKIDAEKNRQALTEAEASLKMLEQTLKLRQEAAAAELKVLEVQRERQRMQMEHARFNYERLVIRSPMAGLVVFTPFWKGGQMGVVQEGDQVRPGAIFMQVVDSTSMIVKARANQLDAALLRPGGSAAVHLDAFPSLRFPGRVESVGALAQAQGWSEKVKTFPVLFSVQGSDPRLIPDISASVDVELEQVSDAVLVPRGAVVPKPAGKSGTVWVKQAGTGGLQAREVKLGPRDDLQWAILEGLKEGEVVATQPPVPAPEPASAPSNNHANPSSK